MKPAVVPEYCEIQFKDCPEVLEWRPGSPPVLDLLEAAGLTPAYSCRYGSCHTCVAELLEGQVAHPAEVTLPGEGLFLPCCAVPLSSRIKIDL